MTVLRPQRTRPLLPRAARLQPTRNDLDDRLTWKAATYHPGVRWWWGHRKMGSRNVIACYLCDRVLVEGTGIDRLSSRAADAVMLHRADELLSFGLNPGNDAGATVVPADAPPSGGSE